MNSKQPIELKRIYGFICKIAEIVDPDDKQGLNVCDALITIDNYTQRYLAEDSERIYYALNHYSFDKEASIRELTSELKRKEREYKTKVDSLLEKIALLKRSSGEREN